MKIAELSFLQNVSIHLRNFLCIIILLLYLAFTFSSPLFIFYCSRPDLNWETWKQNNQEQRWWRLSLSTWLFSNKPSETWGRQNDQETRLPFSQKGSLLTLSIKNSHILRTSLSILTYNIDSELCNVMKWYKWSAMRNCALRAWVFTVCVFM